MRIGITELIVIFAVALIVVGPDRLPAYAKKLGEALAQFKKYSDEATKDIKESIVEPLEEAQKPLREAVEPFTEIDRAVRSNAKDVQDSFRDIGKPKKTAPVAKGEAEALAETKAPEVAEAYPRIENINQAEEEPT